MRLNQWTFALATLLALVCASLCTRAEDGDTTQLQGRSDQTRKRLMQAEATLREGDATTATNQLQQILDEAGNDWVEVETGRFLPARTIAQQLLAQLPAAALQRYRDRIDTPAQKLLDAGLNRNDPEPLRRLVEDYSVSRHAETALLRLGDIALERGDTRDAIHHWSRLGEATPTQIDPAQLQARIILARILQGNPKQAKVEYQQLETKHPNAVGTIAGVDGKLTDTLRTLLNDPPQPISDVGPAGWPTFGKMPERLNRLPSVLPYYWPDRPTWQVRFPSAALTNETATAWQTAFHPTVLNGIAYVAVAGQVLGYDIKTGDLLYKYNTRTDPRMSFADMSAKVPVENPQRITLTINDHTIYARLGNPQITGDAESVIVAFDPTLKPLHYLMPPKSKEAQATWEGAPLSVQGRMYMLSARFEGTRINHLLACYADPSQEPQWIRPLCNSPLETGPPREQHLLLSYADGNIIFASHTGLIVAINAETGRPAWAVRYPSSSKPRNPYRSLPPPIASEGRLFVAPADGERIFALDTRTGKTLWQSGEMEVEQLLGVSRGRLIATIRKPNRGIRGFNTATGSDREPNGWRVHDDPLLQTFGLGMVSPDLTLWPTSYGTFIMRSDNGTLIRQPMRGVRGNIIFSDDVLLVATPTGLLGYRSENSVMPGPISQAMDAKSLFVTESTGLNPDLQPKQFTIPNRPQWSKPIRVLEQTDLPDPMAMPIPTQTSGDSSLSHSEPLLFMTPSKLLCCNLATKSTMWKMPLHTEIAATTLQLYQDAMLLIGRHSLALYDSTNGQCYWRIHSPEHWPRSHIDHIQHVGHQIVARVNESQLMAWNDRSGKLSWIRDSMGRSQLTQHPMPGTPRFSGKSTMVGNRLITQTDHGEIQQLSLDQGIIQSKQSTFPQPWRSAPIRHGTDSIIMPTTPGTIECHNVVTGQQCWINQLCSPAAWHGPMPQLRQVAGELYCAISVSYGIELYRLDLSNGRNRWSQPTVCPVPTVNLTEMTYDDVNLYLPLQTTLVAINREHGTIAWNQPWPLSIEAGSWKLIIGEHSLLAYPSTPIPIDGIAAITQRLIRLPMNHNPANWLPLLPWSLYDAWMSRTLPLLQHDLETGALRQRIDLDHVGMTIDVRIATERLALAGFGQIYWLSTD